MDDSTAAVAELTRPYVRRGPDERSYRPDWEDWGWSSIPPAADAGDPAVTDDDEDQAAAPAPARGRVAADELPFWSVDREPTVVAPRPPARHTPEAVNTLAWRSGEVEIRRQPRHRRLSRPGMWARLIGQLRRWIA